MCGIAGYVALDRREPIGDARRRLGQMIATIRHRGPDAEGFFDGAGVGLAHARLAVIDLSPEANQPMASDDGRVQVVFNGEIYNFSELRRELEGRGHRFRTRSDTEVIVRGYEAWQEGVLARLRGMFAIALWDGRQERLLLARDSLGKKPLYWAEHDGTLLFASEIKAILVWPGMPREADLGAIHDYLTFQYVPAPATAFKGVSKLEPGRVLIAERGARARIARFRQLPAPAAPLDGARVSREALKEQLVARLREAVRLRLASDVPLGAFLSGGVDSSAVVAMVAQEASGRVRTFTIGFEEAGYDERAYARAVAERYATEHHELVVRADAEALLPAIVYHYGEPFADASAIPTYCVSEIARHHVTVALTGDGGDEAFMGYTRYSALARVGAIAEALPGPARRGLAGLASVLPGKLDDARALRRARMVLGSLRGGRSRLYEPFVSYLSDKAKSRLYGPALRSRLARSSLDRLDGYFAEVGSVAGGAAWADLHTYLPDDLLVKVDVASMAHGLECRAPFLDVELMAWAQSVPEAAKLAGGETKALLKEAMEPYLPRDLLYRPKMGFAAPVDRWMRREMRDLVRATLLGQAARERGLFEPDAVAGLIEAHDRRGGEAPRLWAMLMLELWCQMWLDGPLPVSPPARAAVAATG